jgi:beta-galactosidase
MSASASSPRLLGFADDGTLLRDGQPHRIVSGAIHYFRVHPDLWADRLARIAAMGCNTVETYVAWNFHQPQHPNVESPRFDGAFDVAGFVTLAGSMGLDVLVRPGPYICAEWEFGGLPAWLLAGPEVRLRSHHRSFTDAVDRWLYDLCEQLVPTLATNGGPVVAVQVENEYGSYGNDTTYLSYLRSSLQDNGVDVPLFTSDGPTDLMLTGGTLTGAWATVNFGSRAIEGFEVLRRHRPLDPAMCMEFWCGWFDHWGEPHHIRPAEDAAASLAEILDAGASVNIFMAHGGTSFGPYAGANHVGGLNGYQPTVGSYDYDAPIGEAGELTPKYHAFRNLLVPVANAEGRSVPEPPPDLPRQPPQSVSFSRAKGVALRAAMAPLFEPVESVTVEPMERFGQAYGSIHYATTLNLVTPISAELGLDGLADRAHVFVGGTLVGIVDRRDAHHALAIDLPVGSVVIEVLVEAAGRVNYGPELADRKGLTGVRLGQQHLFGWRVRTLELARIPALASRVGIGPPDPATVGPVLHALTVTAPAAADAFVALPGHGHSRVWLNGFDLGLLMPEGPQRTLYAPGPLWREGDNDLLVLSAGTVGDVLLVTDTPDLGPTS